MDTSYTVHTIWEISHIHVCVHGTCTCIQHWFGEHTCKCDTFHMVQYTCHCTLYILVHVHYYTPDMLEVFAIEWALKHRELIQKILQHPFESLRWVLEEFDGIFLVPLQLCENLEAEPKKKNSLSLSSKQLEHPATVVPISPLKQKIDVKVIPALFRHKHNIIN